MYNVKIDQNSYIKKQDMTIISTLPLSLLRLYKSLITLIIVASSNASDDWPQMRMTSRQPQNYHVTIYWNCLNSQ